MTSCNVVPVAAAEKSLLNKTSKALVGGPAAWFVLGALAMTAMTAVSTTGSAPPGSPISRRYVSTALHGAHRGDAQKKIKHEGYRADEIIVMGLPKTGTTATANALVDVGYNVSHNAGDKLRPQCQVIVNTLESSYPELDRKHPNAKWLILYDNNASRWLNSVQAHVKRSPSGRAKNLPCSFYGCAMGLAHGVQKSFVNNATARATKEGNLITEEAELELLAAYRLYYKRLFAYFKGRPYALVDVREGKYVNLSHIHPALRGPFEAKNTRDHPGQWPKC